MDDTERNKKIAKIAGLVEGKDYWSKQEHIWFQDPRYKNIYECTCCHRSMARTANERGGICEQPPPDYSNMDLLLPVYMSLPTEQRFQVCQKVLLKTSRIDSTLSNLQRFLEHNPAQLLAESLIEAVGEELA